MQTAARMLSQMEFFCGLAMKLADCIAITGFLHVQEKLGEMLSHLEVARAVFYGSEAMAFEGPNGSGSNAPLAGAFHLQTMRIYRRFVEIVQLLGGGGFFYAPSRSRLPQSGSSRPLIDKYARGRAGVSAEERVRLFKLAWDATGSSFAQRMPQYVTYYSGDPIRLTAAYYVGYDKDPLFDIVERALGHRDGVPLPITPTEPGSPVPYLPDTRGMAGTYRPRRCRRARPERTRDSSARLGRNATEILQGASCRAPILGAA